MKPRFLQPQISTVGLVAHYKMYEQTVFDYSLNGNIPSPEGILGGELVTNGDFANWTADDPDNWTVAGESGNDPEISEAATGESHASTPTVGGGFCNMFTTSVFVEINQNYSTVTGRKYRWSIEIDTSTTGSIFVRPFGGSVNNVNVLGVGTHTGTFVAVAVTSGLVIGRQAGATDITFDDVSVKELISPTGLGGEFDGADSIMTVPADPTIDINGKTVLSISAWINAASDGEGNLGRIIDKTTGTTGYFMQVEAEAAGFVKLEGLVYHDGAADARAITNAAIVPINIWSHVSFVYNEDSAKKIKIYLNGVLQALGTDTAGVGTVDDDSAIDLNIGNAVGVDRTFDGIISDVQIYNKALSAEEVLSIYSQTRGRYGV